MVTTWRGIAEMCCLFGDCTSFGKHGLFSESDK
jgi:hypothetical protein